MTLDAKCGTKVARYIQLANQQRAEANSRPANLKSAALMQAAAGKRSTVQQGLQRTGLLSRSAGFA